MSLQEANSTSVALLNKKGFKNHVMHKNHIRSGLCDLHQLDCLLHLVRQDRHGRIAIRKQASHETNDMTGCDFRWDVSFCICLTQPNTSNYQGCAAFPAT